MDTRAYVYTKHERRASQEEEGDWRESRGTREGEKGDYGWNIFMWESVTTNPMCIIGIFLKRGGVKKISLRAKHYYLFRIFTHYFPRPAKQSGLFPRP